ncbi:MAG: DUF2508 family protein [Firmicutes bacterium]|jgi:hypothetical protein|nr:DUF2508 family protein [Bacillota bacterium]
MRFLIRWAKKLSKHFFPRETPAEKEAREFLGIIKKAHQEWEEARNYFDQVNESELVDYAIYAVCAAEKKYVYLYQKAKRQGYLFASPDMYADMISMGG